MSPNARDRARAKRRYVKRQANLAQRAQARRTRQQVLGAVLGIVLVIGGVFALAKFTNHSSKKTATPASPAAASKCPMVTPATVSKPQQFKTAPPKSLAENREWTASLTTTCGDFSITLDGKKAPQTVSSFIYLAQKGFFNNTTCHRLTTSGIYVLQCGDPTGTGSGGPGYEFGIENAPKSGNYPAGTVAMARETGPKTNGSQFFIVYESSQLPTTGGGYSIFGSVATGADVITKLAAAGVAAGGSSATDGAPATPINITSVSVK